MGSNLSDKVDNVQMLAMISVVLLAFLVGGVAMSGDGMTGNFFSAFGGGESPDAPSDVGDFDEIDYNEFSTPLTFVDSNTASSFYLIKADAEMPDAYGDVTSAASDVTSELDSDEYMEVTNTDGDSDYQVKKTDIGADEFVSAGSTYKVMTEKGTYTSYGEITVPEGIKKFAYTEDNPQTVKYEVLQDIDWTQSDSSFEDHTAQITTKDGEVVNEALDASSGLTSRVSDVYSDKEFTATETFEIDNGEIPFGAVSTASINTTDVEEAVVSVMVDGTEVYTASATDDAGDLTGDFVDEDMDSNPVVAGDEVTIEVDVSLTSNAGSSDTSSLVKFDVEEIDGSAQTVDVQG